MSSAPAEKRCFKCGEVKPLTDFYTHKRVADGHLNKCKTCTIMDVRSNPNQRHDVRREYKNRWQRHRRQIDSYGKVVDDPLLQSKDRFRHARAQGYRSGLEVSVARQLEEAGVEFLYEPAPIHYIRPARKARYTPDIILPNGIIVETKGRFVTADRQKHLMVKEQWPTLDIRFVFSNPNSRISKQSKTTYAMWAEKHGFKYAAKQIPVEWCEEEPNDDVLDALLQILR